MVLERIVADKRQAVAARMKKNPLDYFQGMLPKSDRSLEAALRAPGSRFILTERPIDDWIVSVERHYTKRGTEKARGDGPKGICRERVYGRRTFDRAHFLRAYPVFVRRVREHFARRPEALLEIDFFAGQGWEELCDFLERPVPGGAFPHENRKPSAHS